MVGTTYNIFFLLRFASHHLLSLRCFLSSSSHPSMRKHEMNKYYVCEISVAATKESARLQFTFACFSRSVNYHWQNEPFHGENKYLHRHRKWRKNLCTVSHTHTHKKHDVYKQISNLSDEVARFTIRKYAMKN